MGTLCSKRPSGRKITPERVRHISVAKAAKLGTVQRFELEILAQALPCTGLINSTEAHLLLVLINTAPKGAFEQNGQPVVFKSNKQLAFEINRSESRVSYLLSRLFDAGLLTMQDSGNYKRYSGRPVDGQATDACGIDLRILVARFKELSAAVQMARREQAETNSAIRRYRGSVRMIRSLIDETASISTSTLASIESRLERILLFVGKPSSARSAVLKRASALIEWIAQRLAGVRTEETEASSVDNSICLYRENNKHIHNTNPYQPVSSNDERRSANAEQHKSVRAGYASKGAFEESLKRSLRQSKQQQNPQTGVVALNDLLRATPAIQATWGLTVKTWSDLIRAIPQMAVLAGISSDARDGAVREMGEQMAAVAIAVTIQKLETQEVTSAGGYLRAMTERAAEGQLHLSRSVYALVSRNASGVPN